MRKLFLTWAAVWVLVFPSVGLKASQGETTEKQILKNRQKEERKALNLKEHYENRHLRHRLFPKA